MVVVVVGGEGGSGGGRTLDRMVLGIKAGGGQQLHSPGKLAQVNVP